MGTNYYADIGGHKCSECGEWHGHRELHIGKSSAGWAFTLASYRESWDSLDDPETWDDWIELLERPDVRIRNEYGEVIPWVIFRLTVENRGHPNGLSRHNTHREFCYGHGEGTWDYCKPGFS